MAQLPTQGGQNEATPAYQSVSVDVDIAERIVVRYGSRIVLEHVNTQYRLHSHRANYPGGSKQQQVTCFSRHNSDDYWIVKPKHDDANGLALWQQKVKHGDIITLQHYNTGCFLHSHANVKSALTEQGECTAFWGRNSDNNWKIQFKNEGAECWLRGNKINLVHCNTNWTLHSHNSQYPDWAWKQQEVTTFSHRDSNDDWIVTKVEKDKWF